MALPLHNLGWQPIPLWTPYRRRSRRRSVDGRPGRSIHPPRRAVGNLCKRHGASLHDKGCPPRARACLSRRRASWFLVALVLFCSALVPFALHWSHLLTLAHTHAQSWIPRASVNSFFRHPTRSQCGNCPWSSSAWFDCSLPPVLGPQPTYKQAMAPYLWGRMKKGVTKKGDLNSATQASSSTCHWYQ